MFSEALLTKLARPLLLLASIIWGSSFLVMKNAVTDMPVFLLLAIRFTIAAVILAVAFWKRWKTCNKGVVVGGVVMGVFLFLAYATQTYGLTGTTAGKNAFLTAVYCVLVPFFTWVIYHKRPDKFNLIAALLCIGGIGLVSLTSEFSVTWGDGLTLLGGVVFAMHIVAVAHFSKGRDIFLLTTLQFATTAVLSWICGFAAGQMTTMPQGWNVWGGVLYLAVAATAVALLCQSVGQKYTAPATAAILLVLEAPFGVLFGVLFGGEKPTIAVYCGFALIFLAVICSETKFNFLTKKNKKAQN